jgi:hypothetical protein
MDPMLMNTKSALSFIGCLFAVLSSALSAPPDINRSEATRGEGRIEDLGAQLAGRTWIALPKNHTRPGLAPALTFTKEIVAPEGYRYKVNSPHSLTIDFNRAGTQNMVLSPDGRHLKFTFKQAEFTYELLEQVEKPELDLATQLAGTSWSAAPSDELRPGLAPALTFTQETVAPEGYKYDLNSGDSITIHFNHGDTQLLILSTDGKRFQCFFKDKSYEYERTSP